MNTRKAKVTMRHKRIRKKLAGGPERPRLSVHFSGKHIYAQLIDDSQGRTLASVNTTEEAFRKGARANVATATKVGTTLAERGKEKSITAVVFDRGGLQYHGKVKALADAAREGGLQF